MFLDLEEDLEVVGEAENGEQALQKIGELKPDVVLMDLMMPVMDGFSMLQALRSQPELAHIPVIVMTAKDLTSADRKVLNGHIEEILLKGKADHQTILDAINGALKQVRMT